VAFRAALLAALRHNAAHPEVPVRSLLCPDLFAIRRAGTGADALGDAEQRQAIRQTLLAARGVLSPA
jgi:hypothetical protein